VGIQVADTHTLAEAEGSLAVMAEVEGEDAVGVMEAAAEEEEGVDVRM
jgi:hypothetical protein